MSKKIPLSTKKRSPTRSVLCDYGAKVWCSARDGTSHCLNGLGSWCTQFGVPSLLLPLPSNLRLKLSCLLPLYPSFFVSASILLPSAEGVQPWLNRAGCTSTSQVPGSQRGRQTILINPDLSKSISSGECWGLKTSATMWRAA